jgi:hypothetical protein
MPSKTKTLLFGPGCGKIHRPFWKMEFVLGHETDDAGSRGGAASIEPLHASWLDARSCTLPRRRRVDP